jgi:endoglucanase
MRTFTRDYLRGRLKSKLLSTTFLLSLLILASANIYAQTATTVIKNMGPGFNIGNVWDNGVKDATLASVKPIIDKYISEGMTNVRIPTTWMDAVDGNTLADGNGNLITTNSRFTELVNTINYCLSKGLYVTLNTHHETWLKNNYNGSAYYDDKFSNLWKNIATYFKSYPSTLVFEILNEPEGKMGVWDGVGGYPDPTGTTEIGYTRQIMKVGYNAIRATGGNNTTRLVMVSPNGQANQSQIEEVFPDVSFLPGGGADQYLGMHVHSYDPWGFCGHTGWNYNNPGTATFIAGITTCYNHAQTKLGGIPIHYGEFGVGRAPEKGGGPETERGDAVVLAYYKTFAETAISKNMAFSVWDDRGWFNLINDAGTAFSYNIVPTMMTNIKRTIPTTPVLTTITLTPATSAILKGQTVQYTAVGKDQNGTTMTITPTWTVTGGGTISASGLFTSTTAGGPFTVKATSGTISGSATVTVTALALTTITLTPSTSTIAMGKTVQFTAVGKDQNGTTMTITPTWTVTGGGTISAAGLFTATTAGGPFTVKATSGTISGTAQVTVTAAATGIAIPGTVQAEDYSAYNNVQNTQMRVATTDAGGGTKMGYNDAGDWYEYSVNVAAAGTYTVTFRVANGSTATGQFQLKKGTTVLTTVDVAPTGGWDTFVTLTKTVSFTASGTQTISLAVVTAGVDFNWFNAVVATTTVVNSVAYTPNMVVESGDTYTIAVTFSSITANDVNIGLYTAAWGLVVTQTKSVAAGSGVVNFTITIPAATAVGTTYIWQAQIMPVGGTYLQRYANVDKPNVQVTNLKSATLGFDESVNGNDVSIYPSPVSSVLHLSGTDNFNKILLYNCAGQLVKSVQKGSESLFNIDVQNLKNGMYFIEFRNETERITKKIIKN